MHKDNLTILIVDDDKDMRFILSTIVEQECHKALVASNGSAAVELVRKHLPDAVIMDIKMPEMDGLEALRQMKEVKADLPVILITAHGNIDMAVSAIKLGAYDFITKPFDNERVVITLNNAISKLRLKNELEELRSRLDSKPDLSLLMGSSGEIKKVISQVENVSITNFTVVIYGETGSGKELIARGIHNHSSRREGKFVAIDCGSIPETLIESELFGYEKGAFTGAEKRKEGYFELASDGTLFLDEIGNLPMIMQSKLLRALEERCVRRLGGKSDTAVDLRIVAASNERLEYLVKEGKFREDLFHRLNEYTLEIPPLRKRRDDIVYLANRFLKEANHELRKTVCEFSARARLSLLNYNWPGNVRELRNVVRRAVIEVDDTIEPVNLYLQINGSESEESSFGYSINQPCEEETFEVNGLSLKDVVKKSISKIERQVIIDTLMRTGGNKSKAARILKIDNKTIHYKIKEYGIELTTDD